MRHQGPRPQRQAGDRLPICNPHDTAERSVDLVFDAIGRCVERPSLTAVSSSFSGLVQFVGQGRRPELFQHLLVVRMQRRPVCTRAQR